MRYTARESDPVFDTLEPVVQGLGLALIETTVSRHKGATQIRLVVYKNDPIGVDDCSRVHRAILPRLELAFAGQDISVEVSSTGIDRQIKDGREFAHYRGRAIACYRTEISDWTRGILESAGPEGIVLQKKDETVQLSYEEIAKAKLDYVGEER
jgi:ribosome maturation factor RimP